MTHITGNVLCTEDKEDRAAIAQQIKVLVAKSDHPYGEGKEQIPVDCPLTNSHTVGHMHLLHTQPTKINK